MPASTILLVTADPASGERIAGALGAVGYTVTEVADPEEALRKVAENRLVILDVVKGSRTAAEICREIRETPAVAAIPVLCVAGSDEVEERIRFLEAGADDVMARPFDARELEARVEALLLRVQRSADLSPVVTSDGVVIAPRRRRTIAVYSPKGGAGTTTIATNIALVKGRETPDRVVLVDLDVQFGHVATHLNLDVKVSLAEIARDEAALRESELLRTYALRHDSGLHVIAAPPTPELAELVTPNHVGQVLDTLLGSYDYVVVDAGATLDERTMTIFEKADVLVVPVHPEIAALKSVRTLVDYLNETGSTTEKTSFVLNNIFAREILRMRDVETALGARVIAELPYDPFLYLKAVNEGIPIVAGAPRSLPAQQFRKIAENVFGPPVELVADVPHTAPPRKSRGFGLLRRS